MTGFDIIVLVVIGIGAIGGFLRGFVQEILSLVAWILAVFAIRYLHTDLSEWLFQWIGTPSGASVLAFVLLLLIPYAAMKLIAGRIGEASRASFLGPIDRVLGFGFGVLKGAIIVVMAFSVLVLGYDTIWGPKGRPTWITNARTYRTVDAAAEEMVQLIAQRREELRKSEAGISGNEE
jgi:membrane protein required for colicin V production